jgi:hypothetical protein
VNTIQLSPNLHSVVTMFKNSNGNVFKMTSLSKVEKDAVDKIFLSHGKKSPKDEVMQLWN